MGEGGGESNSKWQLLIDICNWGITLNLPTVWFLPNKDAIFFFSFTFNIYVEGWHALGYPCSPWEGGEEN